MTCLKNYSFTNPAHFQECHLKLWLTPLVMRTFEITHPLTSTNTPTPPPSTVPTSPAFTTLKSLAQDFGMDALQTAYNNWQLCIYGFDDIITHPSNLWDEWSYEVAVASTIIGNWRTLLQENQNEITRTWVAIVRGHPNIYLMAILWHIAWIAILAGFQSLIITIQNFSNTFIVKILRDTLVPHLLMESMCLLCYWVLLFLHHFFSL